MKRLTAFIASAIFILALAAAARPAVAAGAGAGVTPVIAPANVSELPDLTISANPGIAPFTLLAACGPGKHAITFHLYVANIGNGASPPINNMHAVWVQAITNPAWAGGAALPAAIAAHSGLGIDVDVNALTPASAMWGHHVFNVTVNAAKTVAETNYANNSATIALDIPQGFCTPGSGKPGVTFVGNPGVGIGPTPTHNPSVMLNPLATPTPKPYVPPMALAMNPLAAPHLNSTTDPSVCASHFGSDVLFVPLLCGAAIKAGLMLVWDWSPTPSCPTCPQSVDGYNVYRTDGGRHQKLVTQSPQDVTGWGPPVPSDGWAGKCYRVSAVAGSQESFMSNQVCVGGIVQVGTQTVTFSPQLVRTAHHRTTHKSGICNSTDTVLSFDNKSLEVGYDYHNFTAFCDEHTSNNYRGGVLFDVSSLAGKKIFKATLHLGQIYTEYNGSPNSNASYQFVDHPYDFTSSSWSCGNVIGIGTNTWWSIPSWFAMSDFNSWSGSSTPIDIDVTTKVAPWLQGSPNYGFVMRSSIEGDLNDFQYLWACTTTVSQPSLTVEYFP